MAKAPKTKTEIQEEPGAEDRFLRGVSKVLKTPPKPHKPKASKGRGGARRHKSRDN